MILHHLPKYTEIDPTITASTYSQLDTSYHSHPPDHLGCICEEGGCLMGVQCGTLRGVGSPAYLTLEGGEVPNTVSLERRSTLQSNIAKNVEQYLCQSVKV